MSENDDPPDVKVCVRPSDAFNVIVLPPISTAPRFIQLPPAARSSSRTYDPEAKVMPPREEPLLLMVFSESRESKVIVLPGTVVSVPRVMSPLSRGRPPPQKPWRTGSKDPR